MTQESHAITHPAFLRHSRANELRNGFDLFVI
jgi:hypothetical protein